MSTQNAQMLTILDGTAREVVKTLRGNRDISTARQCMSLTRSELDRPKPRQSVLTAIAKIEKAIIEEDTRLQAEYEEGQAFIREEENGGGASPSERLHAGTLVMASEMLLAGDTPGAVAVLIGIVTELVNTAPRARRSTTRSVPENTVRLDSLEKHGWCRSRSGYFMQFLSCGPKLANVITWDGEKWKRSARNHHCAVEAVHEDWFGHLNDAKLNKIGPAFGEDVDVLKAS